MDMVDHVSLRYENNDRFHDDLLLRVGERMWRCDTYYLLLDRAMLPDREDDAKVRAVLARLLEQWRAAVAALDDGGGCFLPYDFSDEYTGWLRCEAAAGEMLTLQRGWSRVAGYAIMPSNVDEAMIRELPDFQPDGDAVAVTRELFLRGIGERA